MLKQILAKASHRSQKNKKFLLCVANKKEGLHFANFSKSWKAFRVLSLLFPSADFVHPSVSQGFALLCFLTKCLLSCKLLYFRENKKTSFLRPKGNTFEELPIFLTFCPQCCFLAQSFLFQVHGQFCLKTLMLSVFFFLKKSLLFAKSNKKKTNEQIQNNELFSSC